ncbi:MAG: excinuclease ABC subunit UvrB [Candidatus Coatesbacteria bacterium]|nr:excinuclease ABC subunit UvrB [Candidatus Coatesbacteria bacterium]
MPLFKLHSPFNPAGDQPQAIDKIVEHIQNNERYITLLGVTGSGKTYTLANVIARLDRPVLVISHNKTLAAQLYAEFSAFFPENAVGFFISYYDYYQPEAYIPRSDQYIPKDADVNQDIDRMRLAATSELLSRRDVIIVASVSCIYGLGAPGDIEKMVLKFKTGDRIDRYRFFQDLAIRQYSRNDLVLNRGEFQVKGDIIDIFPSYEERIIRIELFDDEIERISFLHQVTKEKLKTVKDYTLFPAKHFVMPEERLNYALKNIKEELKERYKYFTDLGRIVEAERIKTRTEYDLDMLQEMGYCSGIENYSRHFDGRSAGTRPACLLDYFPKDFITIVDESHMTIPQLHGMYRGDRSRKETLIEYGFRLPSALDNRPLFFEEWEILTGQTIYMSATPGPHEKNITSATLVEQVIRPTGLVDPEVEVRPAENQIEDLLNELKRKEEHEKILITTLTKRMSEDLSEYLLNRGYKVAYLHSDIDSLDRIELLKNFHGETFQILVGINLLREGLDLPKVTLVAILDADKEGFLRSETSLIQTSGRAARNVTGKVILYADRLTGSIQRALGEMNRRREKQLDYNKKHGIIPRSITPKEFSAPGFENLMKKKGKKQEIRIPKDEIASIIEKLKKDMIEAANNLDFEKAAFLRDQIMSITGELPIT